MTKLQEWLAGLGILFAIWFHLITSKDHSTFANENYNVILYSPIVFVLIFGVSNIFAQVSNMS